MNFHETIIPSALETPMSEIEIEAICATVMRILCSLAQIAMCKRFGVCKCVAVVIIWGVPGFRGYDNEVSFFVQFEMC